MDSIFLFINVSVSMFSSQVSDSNAIMLIRTILEEGYEFYDLYKPSATYEDKEKLAYGYLNKEVEIFDFILLT